MKSLDEFVKQAQVDFGEIAPLFLLIIQSLAKQREVLKHEACPVLRFAYHPQWYVDAKQPLSPLSLERVMRVEDILQLREYAVLWQQYRTMEVPKGCVWILVEATEAETEGQPPYLATFYYGYVEPTAMS